MITIFDATRPDILASILTHLRMQGHDPMPFDEAMIVSPHTLDMATYIETYANQHGRYVHQQTFARGFGVPKLIQCHGVRRQPGQKAKLITKEGHEIPPGMRLFSQGVRYKFTTVEPPRHDGSSGRIYVVEDGQTSERGLYPTVFNAFIVRID